MGRSEKRRPVRLRAYQAGLGLLEQLPDGSVGSCCTRSMLWRAAQVGFAASLQDSIWLGTLPPNPARFSGTRSGSPVPLPPGWPFVRGPGFSTPWRFASSRTALAARLTFLGRTPTGLPLSYASTRPSWGTYLVRDCILARLIISVKSNRKIPRFYYSSVNILPGRARREAGN
jgi:hypothetical protein